METARTLGECLIDVFPVRDTLENNHVITLIYRHADSVVSQTDFILVRISLGKLESSLRKRLVYSTFHILIVSLPWFYEVRVAWRSETFKWKHFTILATDKILLRLLVKAVRHLSLHPSISTVHNFPLTPPNAQIPR